MNVNVLIILIGATFKKPDTGLRVLLRDDAQGNALIITENVFDVGTKYNNTNLYSLYENSAL